MRVEFSDHALKRADQRLPHMGLRGIANEIADAIEAGRVSREPPSWRLSNAGERNGQNARRGIEFAWSADRSRIYVIGRRRKESVVLATIVQGARVAA